MSHYRTNGFTIIETTLVMAITGLLVVMVLSGIGASLSHQKYTDAVNQTVSFFRAQYSQTANISNERPDAEVCNSSGISATGPGSTRGASDCLLLGHVVRSTNGKNISVYQVIARHDPTSDANINTRTDGQILAASSLLQGSKVTDYTIDWDTRLLTPGTSNAAAFSLMIVRVPVSGTVVTYTSNSGTSSVAALLGAVQADKKLCIDQAGFFSLGINPMGVLIKRGASNTTGVQPVGSGDCN